METCLLQMVKEKKRICPYYVGSLSLSHASTAGTCIVCFQHVRLDICWGPRSDFISSHLGTYPSWLNKKAELSYFP